MLFYKKIKPLNNLDLRCDFKKKIIQKIIWSCRAILGHNLLMAYRMNLWQRHCCLCSGMGVTVTVTLGVTVTPKGHARVPVNRLKIISRVQLAVSQRASVHSSLGHWSSLHLCALLMLQTFLFSCQVSIGRLGIWHF